MSLFKYIIYFIGKFTGKEFRLLYHKKSKGKYLWGVFNYINDTSKKDK